uniref:Germin-like protein n=1 Tax=Solanum lycopersicum TaxID=4081 RepID=K4CW26_SOLLC
MRWLITILVIATFFSSQLAYAYDDNPLQNICVAVQDSNTSVFVNGKICKDPKLANADDFFTWGFNISGETIYKKYGYATKIVDINNMPGLNTLGISIVRADLEPKGFIQFHIHPRATEIINILSRLFAKVLNRGDVFVIPRGLIHFIYNVGSTNATVFASFNSQSPGLIFVPDIIFASDPPIMDDALCFRWLFSFRKHEHIVTISVPVKAIVSSLHS